MMQIADQSQDRIDQHGGQATSQNLRSDAPHGRLFSAFPYLAVYFVEAASL
jgi:hypothetical protein